MPTTPKGIWFPGPTEPFPPGFAGNGGPGFFEQLATSVDERLIGPIAFANVGDGFTAVSDSANVLLTGLEASVEPPDGHWLRITFECRYTATDSGSIGAALRGLIRVDTVFVRDGGGPATIASTGTSAKVLHISQIVATTGQVMDIEIFGRSTPSGGTVDIAGGSNNFLLVEDLGPALT